MSKENKTNELEKFDNSMHTIGRVTTTIIFAMLIVSPFIVALYLGTKVNVGDGIKAALSLCVLFLPASIVEVITYAPMLGTGATYLAFMTGNLTNLKIPCCMNARNLVGTEFGTKENEVVSTISVAISSLVTIVVVAIGVALLVPLEPIINSPTLQPAFSTVIPALFGALGYQYVKEAPKVAIIPFALVSAVCFIVPSLASQVVVLIGVSAIVSVIVARILYKKGEL